MVSTWLFVCLETDVHYCCNFFREFGFIWFYFKTLTVLWLIRPGELRSVVFRTWTLSVMVFLFSIRAAGFSLRAHSLLCCDQWTWCTKNQESCHPIVLVMHINKFIQCKSVSLAVVRTLAQMLTGCLSCFCRFTRTGPITTWPNLAVSASSRTWARTSPMESCWHRSSRS